MGENKDKIKGKAKEIVGAVTGNRRMQVEGLGLQARGVIRGAAKDVKQAIARSTKRAAPSKRPTTTTPPARGARARPAPK